MAVLGLRGTGNWSTDERPKNYRQAILLLFPNTPASLTALMSQLKEEQSDDPEFKVFIKGLPTQRATVNGSHSAAATTIAVNSSLAKIFKKGHAILNERTLEVMWVTADPSVDTEIEVSRGKGSTAATINTADALLIVGSHHQEGASVPTAITYDPTVVTNYLQIFRNAVDITGTGRETRLRTGDALKEYEREVLEMHGIEMEKAFLFGTGVEDTSGAHPERTTKGLLTFIATNITDFADAVTQDSWDNFLEDLFEDGSNQKLFLCGNRALNVINKLAKQHGQIQLTPKSETYGMQLMTYVTPFGELQLKQHPLLSKSATFNDWGFAIDAKHVVYRYMKGRDTKFRENVQNPGDDAVKSEWLTEAGLEVQHETTHALAKNMSAFAP
jgi:hypothetical protein